MSVFARPGPGRGVPAGLLVGLPLLGVAALVGGGIVEDPALYVPLSLEMFLLVGEPVPVS